MEDNVAFVQVLESDVSIAGKAIVARDFVYVDWTQVDSNLQGAFAFLSSLRIERVQLWATDQVKLANAPITAKPCHPSLPPIQGAIAGVEALDAAGANVAWNAAHAVAFTIAATASVTLPKAAISAAVGAINPLVGIIIGGLLATLGSNVQVNIGHTAIHVPIVRDGANKIVEIGNAKRP
jgi:hypothetical protein